MTEVNLRIKKVLGIKAPGCLKSSPPTIPKSIAHEIQLSKNVDIFYINIARSRDRRIAIEKQFRELGLPAHRIDGFDGSQLSVEQLNLCNQAARKRRFDTPLTPNEIGCFLSHRRAWEMIAMSGKKALVLEDDVALAADLSNVLRRLNTERLPFVRLGGVRRRKSLFVKRHSEMREIRLLLSGCSGGHAYILTPDGADSLLAASETFLEAVDVFLDMHWASRGAMYTVLPWPIELSAYATSSTIGDERSQLEQVLHQQRGICVKFICWLRRQKRSMIKRWWSMRTCIVWAAKHGLRDRRSTLVR